MLKFFLGLLVGLASIQLCSEKSFLTGADYGRKARKSLENYRKESGKTTKSQSSSL